jgi:alpha-beta hydrolase superfamily lysophospholipase
MTSGGSAYPKVYDDTVEGHDIVLNVDQIRRWAHQLGDHVTLARIPGALHDITLSAEPVRRVAFDEISRWLGAYVEQ